jgi:prophage DNA circulation protein
MPVTLDILERLLPLTWRGIKVPCLANSAALQHSTVEHNQYGVSGGEIENTCRKSVKFQFRVMFRNGLAWSEILYPYVFRDFWNACTDRTTGPLIHPEFGLIDCKVESANVHYDPTWRDGCDLDVTWSETIEKGISIELAASSPITHAVSMGEKFDQIKGTISPVPEYNDGSGTDLLGALKKIQGAMLLLQLTMADLAAQVDNVIVGVNGMIDQVSEVADPKSWAVVDTLNEIVSALTQAAESLGAQIGRKKIEIRTTTAEGGAMLVAARYGQTPEDFFKLNPAMAARDPIPPGTDIFVYSDA